MAVTAAMVREIQTRTVEVRIRVRVVRRSIIAAVIIRRGPWSVSRARSRRPLLQPLIEVLLRRRLERFRGVDVHRRVESERERSFRIDDRGLSASEQNTDGGS